MHISDIGTISKLLSKHDVLDGLIVVRLSSKAKRLLFKSSIIKGVEIVIPRDAPLSWVVEVTRSRIPWIRNTQQQMREGRNELNPIKIDLKALGETWSVKFEKTDGIRNGLLVSGERTLTVGVDPNDVFYSARKLQDWVHHKAKASLPPWLDSLAEDRGLRFERSYVKHQVSLWGSCSKKRNINLNRNLLFIPKHLVEYVLHHELTHLIHLNHSRRFWNSLCHVLPDCGKLSCELNALRPGDIPLWASSGINSI